MRGLIVNADDFGLTAGVNRAIREGHQRGVLTSTSVLVTARHAEEAGELPDRLSELDVGLHVNLTLGEPAADPASIRSLVNGDGRLLSSTELLRRMLRGRVRSQDVNAEVAAQAARLRAMGVQVSHWDAHEAVAFWPGLLRPAAAAAAGAGIRRVRTPRLWMVGSGPAVRWRWRLKRPVRLLTDANRAVGDGFLRRSFLAPHWRTSPNLILTSEEYRSRWERALTSIPDGICEAVSHPAFADDEIASLSRLTTARDIDREVLTDPGLAGRLAASGVQLMRFRDLVR
jgi:predicted glycoside hydrolase/deacetylase ChbG (UPF0249 family)